MPNAHSVIAAVVLPLGLLALAWVALAFRGQRRFLKKAQRATGVVQELTRERWGKQTMYFPVIRFITNSGATVSVKSKTGRGGSPYRVGQTISVLYDPAIPKNVTIDTLWSRWIMVVIPAFFALVLLGIGGAALLTPS